MESLEDFEGELQRSTGNDILPTERAPMLSDEQMELNAYWITNDDGSRTETSMSGESVRDFYEAKITNGELRMVKKVGRKNFSCLGCGQYLGRIEEARFCPTCGDDVSK